MPAHIAIRTRDQWLDWSIARVGLLQDVEVRRRVNMWIFSVGLISVVGPTVARAQEFRPLAPGLEMATFPLEGAAEPLFVVRVDPRRATLRLFAGEGTNRTAAQWAKEKKLRVVINAGMYQTDHRRNVGYLKAAAQPNNPHWRRDYRSVLLIDPKDAARPRAQLVDSDLPGFEVLRTEYASLVQNLRLIKSRGRSVWKENQRRWSEAAVAQDQHGKILLLFSRSPFSMAELNARLLSLPLGIDRAMHVEGGPEASLSIHAGDVRLDLSGSFETGFTETDQLRAQWPLPNVLGVLAEP